MSGLISGAGLGGAALIAIMYFGPSVIHEPACIATGTLNSGKTFSGALPASWKSIEATNANNEEVLVVVEGNPPWASTDVVLEIQWNDSRKVYVLRGLSWTAEVKTLAGQFSTVSTAGSSTTVPLGSIRQLTVTCPKRSN